MQASIDATTGGVCQAIRLVNPAASGYTLDRSFTLAHNGVRPTGDLSTDETRRRRAHKTDITPKASSTGSTATCSTPRTITGHSPLTVRMDGSAVALTPASPGPSLSQRDTPAGRLCARPGLHRSHLAHPGSGVLQRPA
ncbi:MAG: hypothetical protein R3A10_13125 [Caldilineaceae bacterium]